MHKDDERKGGCLQKMKKNRIQARAKSPKWGTYQRVANKRAKRVGEQTRRFANR